MTLKVGTCVAKNGKITSGYLNIAKKIKLPIYIAQGKKEGRTIFISAGNHGDELNGIYLLQKFLEFLDVKKLKGTIIFLPLLNPSGFSAKSREVHIDQNNLNRSYPGKSNGTITERIAYSIFENVVKQCSFGIDLHDSGSSDVLLPHVRTHLSMKGSRTKLGDPTGTLAAVFGTEIIVERKGHSRMMAVAAFKKHKIPVITVEIGGGLIIQKKFVQEGLQGLKNVLISYAMLPGAIVIPKHQFVIRYDQRAYYPAKEEGLLLFHVELGDSVKKGQLLAEIRNPFTTKIREIKAKENGVVIARRIQSKIDKGESALSLLHFCGPGSKKAVCSRFLVNEKKKGVKVVHSKIASKFFKSSK